jgi:hypothetical protein
MLFETSVRRLTKSRCSYAAKCQQRGLPLGGELADYKSETEDRKSRFSQLKLERSKLRNQFTTLSTKIRQHEHEIQAQEKLNAESGIRYNQY